MLHGEVAPCQRAEGLLREEDLGRFGRVGQAGEEHYRKREQPEKGADIEATAVHLHPPLQPLPALGTGPVITCLCCAPVLVYHLAGNSVSFSASVALVCLSKHPVNVIAPSSWYLVNTALPILKIETLRP